MVFSKLIAWIPSLKEWRPIVFMGFFHGKPAYMDLKTGRWFCPFTEKQEWSETYLPAEGAVRVTGEEL